MLTQTLPATASRYGTDQRFLQRQAIAAVRRQWRRMGGNFDQSWAAIAPTITAILLEAQGRVVAGTDLYIPAVLAETGQPDRPISSANTALLVGVTGAGQDVAEAIALAPIRAKQAVADGMTQFQALKSAGQWLTAASGLLLSDTGRAAEGLNMYSREDSGGGFVRMLTPPSCGRCVVMAGKWFRYNEGFSRHPPTCDCRHIPASESLAGDITVDPRAYFDSLDEAGQNKLAGSIANGRAVRDGADLVQIVNAYRKSAGMQAAGDPAIRSVPNRRGGIAKVTDEGTSRRSRAGIQQRGLRLGGKVQRLMPETIYMNSASRDDALRLLKFHGWIADETASARGRAILADQTRGTRAEAQRLRRARRRSADTAV